MEKNTNSTISQKYLGERGFVLFVAFLGAFIPLSTDVYLPALPRMVENLHTTSTLVNLTLVLFFVFYAVGTLFWGPLSDKYGRKPILLVGLSIYLVASILCVFASNIYLLIVFRVLQSIGCGAATAVSTAVIKDTFSGKKRGHVIAIVQSLATTSPIVSPVIGAFILSVMSWRGVFVVLAIIGVISLIGAILMQETIQIKSEHSVLTAFGRLGHVAQNKGFMRLLLIFSITNIAFMSFITGSSYIYIDYFGVSEKSFSYFFAINAVFLLLGPLAYIQVTKFLSYRVVITLGYIVFAISGLLALTIGHLSPVIFCLSIIPAALFGNMMGPARMNLMIEQIKTDIGSASSMISATFNIFGCIGMLVISYEGISKIVMLGSLYLVLSLVSLGLWLYIKDKAYIVHVQ